MTADSWKSLIIKILLMILTPLAAQLHLTMGATDLSAIATDLADLGVLGYGVYRSNGMKLVPHDTIVKVLIACFLVSLFLVPRAEAGDINSPIIPLPPLKAMAAVPCQLATATTPLSCSGAYVGGGLAGAGSNANIIGGGIQGSVFAGGMTPSLDAGYQYVQGNWIFAGELDTGYSFGSNALGNSYNGFRISEVFKVGGNLSALFGTQAPITIPAQLASAVIGPYAFVAPTQWQFPHSWANGTGSGAGVLFDFGSRWFGDLRYTYTDFSSAKAIPGVTIQNDQSLRFAVNYKLN